MEIVNLSEKNKNGKSWSAKEALKDATKTIKDTDKVLILVLDNEGDNYNTKFLQAGLNFSQCIALMEVQKTVFLKDMGYI